MGIFKISTKQSMFPPIRIGIDDKIYTAHITTAILAEVQKHEEAARRGDVQAVVKQVALMLECPVAVLAQVDVRDLHAMLEHLGKESVKTKVEDREKNVSRPGAPKPA